MIITSTGYLIQNQTTYVFFFFNDPAPTEFYPLPHPAALPIEFPGGRRPRRPRVRRGRGMPHRHAGRWSAWFGGTDDRAVRAPGGDARGPASGNAQRPLHRAHTVRVLPRAHRGPRRPRARTALGHRGESGRAAHRAGARRRAEGEGPARTTAWHPGARERQRGYRGPDGHNRRLARAARREAPR